MGVHHTGIKVDWARLGADVRTARQASGLERRKFGLPLKIHHTTLKNCEEGRSIGVAPMLALCRLMARDPLSYLISDAPAVPAHSTSEEIQHAA